MQKEVYVIDIETRSNIDGKGETIPWQGEIIGLGLCWGEDFETESIYYSGAQIAEIVKWLSDNQLPLVAYNTLFEVNWLSYHYEHLPLNWVGDAALLAIALDNSANSFSLKDTAPRLVSYEPWETDIQRYCVDTFKVAASKWGSCIPLLPADILAEYCRKDCHATWLIWQEGCRRLQIDHIHAFFMAEVFLTSQAYLAGTKVDREKAIGCYTRDMDIVSNTDLKFMTHPDLIPHIEAANRARYNKKLAEQLKKSKTGRVKPTDYDTWLKKNPFKTSTQQLAEVFKSQKIFWNPSKLIHEWPEVTAGGQPCLDVDHIHMYGVGGKILAEAGTLETQANKFKQVIESSAHDSRCHFDINLISVRSTRVSSSGLNIVATPLDTEVGDCFIADDGWSFVMTDFMAAEPTVSAMISNDEQLKYCCYFGEGIRPYWKNGVLQIDDTYLCFLSATTRWGDIIRQELDFNEWLSNPEGVKKKFKIIRQISKKIVLMTGYGSGIEKVCSSIYKELGVNISVKEGQNLIHIMWSVFPDLYKKTQQLKGWASAGVPIRTWLGFPITADSSVVHCIWNYRVQTEAAHVMKQILWQIYQRKQDWFIPSVVNIHDASCYLVQDDHIEEFQQLLNDSLQDVNNSLVDFTNGLKFRISTHIGKTLRQAKEG